MGLGDPIFFWILKRADRAAPQYTPGYAWMRTIESLCWVVLLQAIFKPYFFPHLRWKLLGAFLKIFSRRLGISFALPLFSKILWRSFWLSKHKHNEQISNYARYEWLLMKSMMKHVIIKTRVKSSIFNVLIILGVWVLPLTLYLTPPCQSCYRGHNEPYCCLHFNYVCLYCLCYVTSHVLQSKNEGNWRGSTFCIMIF